MKILQIMQPIVSVSAPLGTASHYQSFKQSRPIPPLFYCLLFHKNDPHGVFSTRRFIMFVKKKMSEVTKLCWPTGLTDGYQINLKIFPPVTTVHALFVPWLVFFIAPFFLTALLLIIRAPETNRIPFSLIDLFAVIVLLFVRLERYLLTKRVRWMVDKHLSGH